MASGLPVASVPAPGPGRPGHRRGQRRHRRRSRRRLPARAPLLARARPRQRRRGARCGRGTTSSAPTSCRCGRSPVRPPRRPRPSAGLTALSPTRRDSPAPSRGAAAAAVPSGWWSPVCDARRTARSHRGAKTMIVEPELEPPHLLTLLEAGVARRSRAARRTPGGTSTSRKRSRMLATRIDATGTRVTSATAAASRVRMTACSFLQNRLLDAADGDGVGVPGVSRDVRRAARRGIRGGVKPVIHARRQAQRDVAAVAVEALQRGIVEEIRAACR